MPRAKRTEAPDAGARDKARLERARLVKDSQLAEEAQMAATIAAVEAKIDTMNVPPAGVTINGNQGRPE